MIPLIKSTFYQEESVKKKLIEFITSATRLSMGEHCVEFEKKFAQFQEHTDGIIVNSGSSANLILIQALLNLGRIKKGDAVGVSAVTWATNVMPLLQLGLKPVLVDVSLETLNCTPKHVEQAITTHNITCMFITNLLGFCDQLVDINELCTKHNVILIEDNCESLGSVHKGKKLGAIGLASTSSLYVGHHLSTIEGGFVCTSDKELARMLRMTRAHGWDRNLSKEDQQAIRKKHNVDDFYAFYSFYTLGYNVRPNEITGFLGCQQMGYASDIVSTREQNYKQFQQAALRNNKLHHLNMDHLDVVSNFAFPLVFKEQADRDASLKAFQAQDIEVRPIVGGSMREQPFFSAYAQEVQTPHADHIHTCGFYLPNNPELTQEEITLLCNLINGNH